MPLAVARRRPAPGPENGWQADVVFAGVTGQAVSLEATGTGGLDVVLGDSRTAFRPAPPPLAAEIAPPPVLTYPGSFVAIECIRAHAAVRQLWLWREGETLHAVGVFRTFLHGRTAEFVTPAIMGTGRTGTGEWSRWFAVMFTGHGLSADIPTCRPDA